MAADAASGQQVPVLDVQGCTDHLFPEVEVISLVNRLRAIDRGWPVSVHVADVGHAIAQNKASDWAPINAAANAFLDDYLLGSGKNLTGTFTVRVTTCDGSVGTVYAAPRWAGLIQGRLGLTDPGPHRSRPCRRTWRPNRRRSPN